MRTGPWLLALVPAAIALTTTAHAQAAAPPAGATAVRTASLSSDERRAVEALDQNAIREVTSALAAPAMEGRGTALPGGDRAAAYIADRFKAMGLAPLGDSGTYFQHVPFVSVRILPATAIATPQAQLRWGSDFVLVLPPGADSTAIRAPAVFVGYGVVSPELHRDDIGTTDLSGKIAIVLRGTLRGVDAEAWGRATNASTIVRTLASRGAIAFAFVDVGGEGASFAEISDYLVRRRVELAAGAPRSKPIVAYLSDSAASLLWAGSGQSYAADRSRAESGQNVARVLQPWMAITVHAHTERGVGSNVIAALPGHDVTGSKEAVIFTAHYDAYGVEGARIYPGAADNALGVATMLAVAADLARQTKLRRAVIFEAVTGEEHGLLGAAWWADHPTWPLSRVVADLNIDGIGTETYGPVAQVTGFGAEYSTLGPLLDDAAASLGLRVIPDPFPEEQAFYRSDHYMLVQHGVPALMVLGGPAGDSWRSRAKAWLGPGGDYHQPGDSVRTDWNWSGPRTLGALTLVMAMRIANDNTVPAWNPGAPFSRERKQ